jgi:hypothetical protein
LMNRALRDAEDVGQCLVATDSRRGDRDGVLGHLEIGDE